MGSITAVTLSGNPTIDDKGEVGFGFEPAIAGSERVPDKLEWLWLRQSGGTPTHYWLESGGWAPYNPNAPPDTAMVGGGGFSGKWFFIATASEGTVQAANPPFVGWVDGFFEGGTTRDITLRMRLIYNGLGASQDFEA